MSLYMTCESFISKSTRPKIVPLFSPCNCKNTKINAKQSGRRLSFFFLQTCEKLTWFNNKSWPWNMSRSTKEEKKDENVHYAVLHLGGYFQNSEHTLFAHVTIDWEKSSYKKKKNTSQLWFFAVKIITTAREQQWRSSLLSSWRILRSTTMSGW